jgi:hypothetical protein
MDQPRVEFAQILCFETVNCRQHLIPCLDVRHDAILQKVSILIDEEDDGFRSGSVGAVGSVIGLCLLSWDMAHDSAGFWVDFTASIRIVPYTLTVPAAQRPRPSVRDSVSRSW